MDTRSADQVEYEKLRLEYPELFHSCIYVDISFTVYRQLGNVERVFPRR